MSRTIYQNVSFIIILALITLPIQVALGAVSMRMSSISDHSNGKVFEADIENTSTEANAETNVTTKTMVNKAMHNNNIASKHSMGKGHTSHKQHHDDEQQSKKHCNDQSDKCQGCSSCAHCISNIYISRSTEKEFTSIFLAPQPISFKSVSSLVNLRPPRFS